MLVVIIRRRRINYLKLHVPKTLVAHNTQKEHFRYMIFNSNKYSCNRVSVKLGLSKLFFTYSPYSYHMTSVTAFRMLNDNRVIVLF